MDQIRLGDIIDDHCSKCHLLTNHSVVALIDDKPQRVRCRTCNEEHKYRHARESSSKKAPSRKAALFDEVLAKMTGRNLNH